MIKTLKSSLYASYGSMLPPLFALAKGALDHTEHFVSPYERINSVPFARDTNQLQNAALGISTLLQGQPFTRERFVQLITESVEHVEPQIKAQYEWLLNWFVKAPEAGGATDQQMLQFLTAVTGIPVITTHLENTKIKFKAASVQGIFIHTCFNQVDISPELTEEL